ncbi:DMT family transporter [Parvibium lacunae]|uniref:DMT family transporter n=2 Tax=Parvibium lacunae TaxID=1888893 RepID=A0A368L8P9_9BURK|nr:DMT family transporter [Parvibium lacunae]
MLLCTLLWSMAGVVTRHLEAAQGVEVNVWRSGTNALCVFLILVWSAWRRNGAESARPISFGQLIWGSSLLWAAMFTSFMLALTQTTVSNVLIMSSLSPLITALLARLFLKQRLSNITLLAIVIAIAGMCWMFIDGVERAHSLHNANPLLGVLLASVVPLAAATNFVLLNYGHRTVAAPNMVPAIGLGGLLSALFTLPFAWPLQASLHDIFWLSFLGVFQLAIPCMLLVWAAHILTPAEVALMALLEVIFGVLWAWLWAGETPADATIYGGGVVLMALVLNALLGREKTPTRTGNL